MIDLTSLAMPPSLCPQDYVYNLANAVRQLCPASEDAYLKDLERLVRARDPDHSSKAPNGL